jgi:FtsH-binding integral membrane protein
MIDALRQRKRQHLTKVFLLLAAAFVLSCGAAFMLVSAQELTSALGVIGLLLAVTALALAVASVVSSHRFPEPAYRHLYPPGQLGLFRVGSWILAMFSIGPAFLALLSAVDRS